MGPEDLIITHLIKFSLANVSDEIFNVFNGFDIGESYSIRWTKIITLF